MADFAIGQAFVKAHRSILRISRLNKGCRAFATRDASGFITLPESLHGGEYIPLTGIQQATFKVENNDKEFRLLGDGGWSDSITTGAKVNMDAQSYFMRKIDMAPGGNCPVFRGDYEDGFDLIVNSRGDQDEEVYVELLKEMGRTNGETGDYIYDFAGFNGVIRNYSEPNPADDMVMVSFALMGRGRGVFGKLNAGSTPIEYPTIFSRTLATSPTAGDRRWAVTPADNAGAVAASANITVAYTSNGSTPLTELALANSGSGFRLEVGSSGLLVPCGVSLTNGTVTIDPVAPLAASTIYRLIVRDGAITQAVDANGVASPGGYRRPLSGFTTMFQTA